MLHNFLQRTLQKYLGRTLRIAGISGACMMLFAYTGYATGTTLQIVDAAPQGALLVGTTTITATTNINATCRYATVAGTAYASMPHTMQVTGGTTHTIPLTNLEDGKSYEFFLRCQSSEGVTMTTDYRVAFSIAQGALPEQKNPDPVVPTPTTPSPFQLPTTAGEGDDASQIKIDFDGKSRSFKLSTRKTIYVSDRKVTFYGTAPRAAGGTVVCNADGEERTTVAADGTWSLKVKLKDNKKHKMKLRYFNRNGTEIVVDTYTIRIDTEKPKIVDLPEVLYKHPGAKVWWTAKDNDKIKRYKYTVRGKHYKTNNSSFYLPNDLARGTHTVQVRAYDRAGNKTTKDVRVIVR